MGVAKRKAPYIVQNFDSLVIVGPNIVEYHQLEHFPSAGGVDYCGRLFFKPSVRNRAPTKVVYVAVFVCLLLMIVINLTTALFLAMLRRQVDSNDWEKSFSWCSENEVRWKYIPTRVPHSGGLGKAAVKSAKKDLL